MKTTITLCLLSCISLAAAAQSVEWARQGAGPQNTYGNAITHDDDGNLYITGSFRDTVNFGAIQLTESSFGTPYCAKYDSSGTILWAYKDMGGDGVVFDGGSHIYLFNDEKKDVQKADLAGSVVWNKAMFTTSLFGSNGILDLQASPTGFYITGYLSGNGYFGADTVMNADTVGGWDVFVAQYDASGNNLWADGGGGSGLDKGYGVHTDAAGNVYATGYYADTATFGGVTLAGNGSKDCYLIKYNAAGDQLWAKTFGGTGFDLAAAMAEDEAGSIYVTGRYHTEITFGSTTLSGTNLDAFIAKFDTAGNPIWARAITGQGDDEEADLAYAGGRLAFICTTSGDVLADTFSLTGLGGLDQAIGQIDTAGSFRWIHLYGGAGNDEGSGITENLGSLYFNGSFNNDASFDAFTFTSAGSWDIVTGKIGMGSATSLAPASLVTEGFTLFPNPASERITLLSQQSLEGFTLHLTSLTGQTLRQEPALSGYSTHLDLNSLPSGMYLLHLTRGEQRITMRFVH